MLKTDALALEGKTIRITKVARPPSGDSSGVVVGWAPDVYGGTIRDEGTPLGVLIIGFPDDAGWESDHGEDGHLFAGRRGYKSFWWVHENDIEEVEG